MLLNIKKFGIRGWGQSMKVILLFSLFFISCKKYLDKKSDQKLIIPNSITDLQGILDLYYKVNQFDPAAGEASADNYYLTESALEALSEEERRLYTWEKDRVFPLEQNDWSLAFDNVYRANTVIDNLGKIQVSSSEEENWRDVKGQAYFLRGKMLLQIADIWTLAYDENTADSDLGLPLRLDVDFTKPSVRATLRQTFKQIIVDLKEAGDNLPKKALHVMRPDKAAAYAFIARAYLAMRMYDSCYKYANLSLGIKNGLLDYNSISDEDFSIPNFNKEILYNSTMNYSGPIAYWNAKVDSNLLKSYDNHDLRKKVFFKSNGDGSFYFGNSYFQYSIFSGIATDEVLLMRAECSARLGNLTSALMDLNKLMENRWEAGFFFPIFSQEKDEILNIILFERRKELVMRGTRWMDIKRLNKEGRNLQLVRTVGGVKYTLKPNDLKFALPIPEDVISISGMLQNPRY